MIRFSFHGRAWCAVLAAAITLATTPVLAAQKGQPVPFKLAPGQTAVYVKNMHCGGCAKKIARKLYAVKGVVRVETSVKANRAVVTPQAKKKVPAEALWAAVKKAGFHPVKLVGPSGTYTPHPKTGAPQQQPRQATGPRPRKAAR